MTQCVVINQSKHLTGTQVAQACVAATVWAANVAMAWDVPAPTVRLAPNVAGATFGAIYLVDGIDIAGAAGYHDVVGGRPVGKVDVAGCLDHGLSWTVTLTHELGEMMVDPWCLAAAQYSSDSFIAFELCDPVEEDSAGYQVDGVQCSDWLLPAYFAGGPGPYDHLGHLAAPAPSLLPGGYASVAVGGRWTEVVRHGDTISDSTKVNAEDLPARMRTARRHALRVAVLTDNLSRGVDGR